MCTQQVYVNMAWNSWGWWLALYTRDFVSDEPKFEDEIYLPKLKFALMSHGMGMS